ncbi:hypothetical protein FHX34_101341 [Actinoplanes teichomyceticus]|uniref:Uncharacterized protein n=1 Tax=Actinoplanes teichomyceticus TaxID=1867 RepID=A0A561WNE7_ACTTI|nr:hypothetical protein FHX34_101341 [Actinoplanes teichomyceticus]
MGHGHGEPQTWQFQSGRWCRCSVSCVVVNSPPEIRPWSTTSPQSGPGRRAGAIPCSSRDGVPRTGRSVRMARPFGRWSVVITAPVRVVLERVVATGTASLPGRQVPGASRIPLRVPGVRGGRCHALPRPLRPVGPGVCRPGWRGRAGLLRLRHGVVVLRGRRLPHRGRAPCRVRHGRLWNQPIDARGRQPAPASTPQGSPVAAMTRRNRHRVSSHATSRHAAILERERLDVSCQGAERLIVSRLRSIVWE